MLTPTNRASGSVWTEVAAHEDSTGDRGHGENRREEGGACAQSDAVDEVAGGD